MNRTESITNETIRSLIEAPGPCVTIVISGAQVETEVKSALQDVRRQCETRSIDCQGLLDPIPGAVRDLLGGGRRGKLAIFRAPSILAVVPLSATFQPIAAVGDRFHIRTLLAVAEEQKHFYIIALSQNRTRLLKCTQDDSEEVPLEGAALSLRDAMQTRQPDHVLDNRVSAGPSVGAHGAVLFGTSSDADDKDEYMLHFFIGINEAVERTLKGSGIPLIAAGVEHEIALYRRVNTYPELIEPGIHGAPDGLEGGEMHRRALELLKSVSAKAPEDFDKKVGAGRASTHVQEIVTAAWQGRVSQLYFQENASYMGVFDTARQRVKHTLDPLDSPEDLIEAAAWETIRHGGEARVLPSSAMPNGVPVCAVFRYAVQPTVLEEAS
jgi:hypothetical protein